MGRRNERVLDMLTMCPWWVSSLGNPPGSAGRLPDYAEGVKMHSNTAGAQVRPGHRRCCAPHYSRSSSEAINASGALNRPRRRPGGRTASIASSFSVGSTRKYISVVRRSA